MPHYLVTIDLEVIDPSALFRAAIDHATRVDKLSHDDARDLLGAPDAPNIDACLTMLLDPGTLPGCDIDGTDVDTYTTSNERETR